MKTKKLVPSAWCLVLSVSLCAVGLSAFAEKPEISAVSAEGWIDLTVGDRVAAAEEPIVVDPAWGKASEATVEIDGEEDPRQYNGKSIDTWDTTAAKVTPGRYAMTLTAGTETGAAAFWKTGAGWEVLDNSQYNEGIEFQAGMAYLVLNAATVPDDKTLKVVDGAKFEYAEGAGFKGGKLEAPRRYGKVDVEGGLFQIVEKIKGCADNPWVIGDDGEEPPKNLVEAYTNGTDKLVIVGAGTITDLSEIPDTVKNGIEAIEIVDATVKGAEGDAFTGFNNISLTLPDNWQGELPKDGAWYGATGVELTRMPMVVKNVKVTQRYPWNGLVDVNFDLMGAGSVQVSLSVTVDGKKLKNPTVTSGTTFDLGTGMELKGLRLTWDAGTDFGDDVVHEKIKVKLTVSPAEAD